MKIRFGLSISENFADMPALPDIELLEVPGEICEKADFSLPPLMHLHITAEFTLSPRPSLIT